MKRGRRLAVSPPQFVGIVMAVLILVSFAPANAQDMFVVQDIPVDITADSAANARERGIEQASRKAFDELTERLAAEPGFGPPPQVPDEAIQNLVEGIEFSDEKASAVRYLAKITVRFRPEAVRSLYGQASTTGYGRPAGADYGRPMGSAYGRPSGAGGPALLVVPVYEGGGARVIWEQFNPWWQAWQQAVAQPGGMRLILPQGDGRDTQTLSANDAASGARSRIMALADRYSAMGAVVARASLDRTGVAPALDLVVTSFGGAPNSLGMVDRVSGASGESVDAVARRGVSKVMALIEAVPGGQTSGVGGGVPMGGEASTVVTARLQSPADLAEIRREIETVVAREELVSLSRGSARLRLFYSGDPEMLRQSLTRTGIVVTDTPAGWSLSLSDSSASPLTPRLPALSGGR